MKEMSLGELAILDKYTPYLNGFEPGLLMISL